MSSPADAEAEGAVRVAESGDLAAILALQAASPEAAQWSAEDWREALTGGGSRRALAALHQARPAGFLLYQELPDGSVELLNLAVGPALRRRGLGSALLRRLLSIARGEVLLEVRETNAAAIALYRRNGFEQIGRRPGYYRRPAVDALIFRRPGEAPDRPSRGV